jgi:SSS family solute:Na+ symporter
VRDYPKAIISLLVLLITSIILKYTWLDRVKKIPN